MYILFCESNITLLDQERKEERQLLRKRLEERQLSRKSLESRSRKLFKIKNLETGAEARLTILQYESRTGHAD
jgi:hypothetical protein